MSSEAAQKAYPAANIDKGGTAAALFAMRNREAFDRGAVEALRQAAERCANWHQAVGTDDHGMTGWLRDMADNWEVGQ